MCIRDRLHPYYDRNGKFRFKVFPAYEILPFWADEEHTELDMAVRMYEVDVYDGRDKNTVKKVELYTHDGVKRYVYDGGMLVPDLENPSSPYITCLLYTSNR